MVRQKERGIINNDCSPPRRLAKGIEVKHRTGSLSKAEPKYERPVRITGLPLPVLMPRLFQAKWQKLEGGHEAGMRRA